MLAAAALTLLTTHQSAPAPATPTLLLAAPAGRSVSIGRHPIGLSIEYFQLEHDLGSGPCPPPALVRALRALGSPTLRIGGDSQDEVAPAGSARRPGVADLVAGFWSTLGCLERETRIPIVVGLALATGDVAWDARLALAARAVVPAARLSFELGNEPDIYGAPVKWWNGRQLLTSAMPFSTYLERASAVAAALGPGSVIEGPDFASGRWIATVPMLARRLHLRTIDAHFYPLNGCSDKSVVTGSALLSRRVQSKIDERVHLARDARAAGLEAVISETNSASCGGVAGVSDQPPAAVWAVRMVVQALRAGFDSVRFHASGRAYDPFVVVGGTVRARPLYLGLRALAGVLGPGEALQAIPGASRFDGVALSGAGGERAVVLSNYGPDTRWVALHATAAVGVVDIVARAPTVLRSSVAPVRGRARVELPPNSVVAITLAPPR